MIVEYVRYETSGEQTRALLEAYAKASAHLDAAPECLRYEIAQGEEEPGNVIVRIEWTSVEGHMVGFRGGACFPPFLALVRPFIPAIREMKHYRVIRSGSSDAVPAKVPPIAAAETFFHGTKADLAPGDLIEAGRASNYGTRRRAAFVYLTATLDAATWGAELASGEGRGRIYIVVPTGPLEDDPNLTDKKFPGNPTKSYRSRDPLRVVGEVHAWQGHAPEQVQAMRDHLARLAEQGVDAIEE